MTSGRVHGAVGRLKYKHLRAACGAYTHHDIRQSIGAVDLAGGHRSHYSG